MQMFWSQVVSMASMQRMRKSLSTMGASLAPRRQMNWRWSQPRSWGLCKWQHLRATLGEFGPTIARCRQQCSSSTIAQEPIGLGLQTLQASLEKHCKHLYARYCFMSGSEMCTWVVHACNISKQTIGDIYIYIYICPCTCCVRTRQHVWSRRAAITRTGSTCARKSCMHTTMHAYTTIHFNTFMRGIVSLHSSGKAWRDVHTSVILSGHARHHWMCCSKRVRKNIASIYAR